MKRTMLFAALLLGLGLCAFAQEEPAQSEQGKKKFATGLGLEWDMNSRRNFAGGAVLGFDYNVEDSYAIGLTLTVSSNFNNFSVIEPSAMVRWYEKGKGHTGIFAQMDIGVFLIFENANLIPMLMGGLRAGYRLPLGSMFFIEPYGRVGYPFAFGIGTMAGIRF